VSIRDLERRLAEAERQANAWGINDRLRERREDEADQIRADLAEAYAAAGQMAGSGRGRRR
jgi:hypothetical protein